ncbi:C4-dicarboxylate ABC transporter substrate-binding protein [Pigmentiphaga litoralis]|uniref:TRAP transporter small permease subunit n=1 Tax=Pigmentiphaga litoralis TaxID=516702 RepID=UPI00167B306B|nr:TRAP transporter small permease subunit [Pigmentiphaga litoralis]GGX06574.1 C4-dicarboxylate ABC transporter substrate-binding protein [Pigmentiphaga litoralis]
MRPLLAFSHLIDAINRRVGEWVSWLVLVVVVISAGNAIIRKFFHISSNAWLELQWYLFGASFLLAAGYTLLNNDHVRLDILMEKLPTRTQIKIEIFGVIFMLFPMVFLILLPSWPMFVASYDTLERSANSGGLLLWPAKLLIPVGFSLLFLAGVSHLIKCIGYLRGDCPDPRSKNSEAQAEEEYTEQVRLEAERRTEEAARLAALQHGERP